MPSFRYHNTKAWYMCSKCILEIVGKSNNYQFYLPIFLKFCDNISHKLLRSSQFLENVLEILEWSFFQKQISPSPPYSMLKHIGRVATSTHVPKHSQILANNIGNGGGRLLSEFMWGIVGFWGRQRRGFTISYGLFANTTENITKKPQQEIALGTIKHL